MTHQDASKYKLSKSVLEMKFMKKSKERVEKEKEAEDGQAMFSDAITAEMKRGANKFLVNPSYVFCEDLIVGRLSFQGMNPDIEKLMEAEMQAQRNKEDLKRETEVSDQEMAHRYSTLIGTISKKFKTNRTLTKDGSGNESKRKRARFLKPTD